MLGDIFHSTAKVVLPPQDPEYCDGKQCLVTLFINDKDGLTIDKSTSVAEYRAFVAKWKNRQKVRGGRQRRMIHAFACGWHRRPGLIPPDMLPAAASWATGTSTWWMGR